MPGLPLAALRRIGAAAVLLGGIALVGGSVSGIASIDSTLADEARRATPPHHQRVVRIERPQRHQCPPPEHRPRAYY